MGRLVAVGDIHGCAQTLKELLNRLLLKPSDTLLATGDLSSRGPDSKGVHQQLIDLENSGVRLILLIGNHEVMLLAMQRIIGANVDLTHLPDEMFHEAEIEFLLRSNATWATLKSYGFDGVEAREFWAFQGDDPREHFKKVAAQLSGLNWQLPQHHLDLLCRCKTHHIERNCLFVHAGLHPTFLQRSDLESAIQGQLEERAKELCWNRDWLGQRPGFPELVIHGHTPLCYLFSRLSNTDPWKDHELLFKSVIHEGALNIDSGVFLDSGHLTAVEIPEDGDPEGIQFVRVPRIDPVEKDRLWYVSHL